MVSKKIIFSIIGVVLVLTAVTAVVAVNFLPDSSTGTVGEVSIQGSIMPSTGSGMFGDQAVTPRGFRSTVDRALSSGVDGLLVKINSPGGSVVASKDVARVISDTDVPVVCQLKDSAVSGAYWVATECDKVVADSVSMTGSIGVTSAYLEFSGLMEEYGVEFVNLSSGDHKFTGSPFQELGDEERKMLEEQLETVHEEFKEQIMDSRNLTRDEVEGVSTGRTFLGSEAVEKGLIDVTGSRRDSLEILENKTNKSLEVESFDRRDSFNILSLLVESLGEGIGSTLSFESVPETSHPEIR